MPVIPALLLFGKPCDLAWTAGQVATVLPRPALWIVRKRWDDLDEIDRVFALEQEFALDGERSSIEMEGKGRCHGDLTFGVCRA